MLVNLPMRRMITCNGVASLSGRRADLCLFRLPSSSIMKWRADGLTAIGLSLVEVAVVLEEFGRRMSGP